MGYWGKNKMFTKEHLQGILLSLTKPEIHVSRDSRLSIGYKVRLRLNFRGGEPFLSVLHETLNSYDVNCLYKKEEHKTRPRPILRISGITNLIKTCALLPHGLPDVKGDWIKFREILALVDSGAHHTQEGLDRILEIKGEV